jgi:hypothetical protein
MTETSTARRITRRVRADEIQVGDLYIAKMVGGRVEAFEILSTEKIKHVTRGGATVSEIVMIADGITLGRVAPHSKHTIRRFA